jgi:hypothetical protein
MSLCRGRFTAMVRGNFDETGLGFVCDSRGTYEDVGAKTVRIAEPGDGSLTKRQCTLQCFIVAEGKQPRLCIIFRGEGKRISQAEKAAWHPDVDVQFQSNVGGVRFPRCVLLDHDHGCSGLHQQAWADEAFMLKWAETTMAPFVEARLKLTGCSQFLVFCDRLTSHTGDNFRAKASDSGVLLWFYPAGCTDFAQPVDAGFAYRLKDLVADAQNEWMEIPGNLERVCIMLQLKYVASVLIDFCMW